MAPIWRHIARVFATLAAMFIATQVTLPADAGIGDVVSNTAEISYNQEGFQFSLVTNTAEFIIEPRPTASTIAFLRFAPTDPNAVVTGVNGSQFSPDGSLQGPFEDTGAPVTLNGVVLDFSDAVPLVEATNFIAGELFIVKVTDPGQNGSSVEIESLVATVTTDTGDTITLKLFETGPDTGEFIAFFQSTDLPTPQNDAVLSVPEETQLTATYVDSFDETEVSVDTALVDPFGRLFNAVTGDLIDGATVTIVDEVTGAPAEVFGIDGVSAYPSTLVTGSVVTDESGLQYPLAPGEFLFPLIAPGDYRLEIAPPEGLSFPSVLSAENFEGLPNGPFEIIPGSFAEAFTVEATGPLNFDVPLDPAGDLVVLKSTNVATTAVGDFVAYTVSVQNQDVLGLPLVVRDDLPLGFRFQSGTARLNGERVADPEITPDGQTLFFDLGAIAAGQTVNLTYVTAVSAGVELGEAVNAAFAVNSGGLPVSNRSEVAVFVREDLLRSRATIIGRVAAETCDPEADWPREIGPGYGVAGVRLYLETGEFVVTDEDGLYHFEDIEPRTHVIQLDTASLPVGYEPVICEDNTLHAGSAISQFVESRGGVVWRANFYLRATGEVAEEALIDTFSDQTEYLDYDQTWLDRQSPDVAWAYPAADRTPSLQSVNVGIVHPAGGQVQLLINGEPVHAATFSGRERSSTGDVELSRWRGINILEGRNSFTASVYAADGNLIRVLEHEVWFVTDVDRATLVDDQSILVADGRTPPTIAVRIEDAAGRAVHGGTVVEVNVDSPYRFRDTARFENEAPITAPATNVASFSVDALGIAHIELEPTIETGRVRLRVKTSDGRSEEIDAFLRPEKRDWILVGLAEGALGFDRLDPGSARPAATELLSDGRIAFFAKGVVKGDWLLTLAVDTAQGRGDQDTELFEDIDPNAFFTLYGDRSFQSNDAESQFPVFVKIEKNTFFALFGDFDTDLEDTTLSRFSRRLSGFKTVYEGKNVSFSGFVSETNQTFVRDEFAADGTSGPFFLTDAPVVRNSETIKIETRDRFRPDIIVAERSLARFTDYDIDFETGEIFFRLPIEVTDPGLNPNVIVAEYETSAPAERNITAGGRVEARAFKDRVEVGATYVREEGSANRIGASSELVGVDATVQIDKYTEFHGEYATTSTLAGPEGFEENDAGDAVLLEIVRRQEAYSVSAFYRREEAGFGLGQLSTGTGGFERFGATGSLHVGGRTNKRGQRIQHRIDAQGLNETNIATGDSRTLLEAAYTRDAPGLSADIGIRSVTERITAEEDAGLGPRRSLLITSGIRKSFQKIGLNLTATHEQPIGVGNDESTQFPQRTVFGIDKTITSKATLNLRHEILNGQNASGQNTVAGLTIRPWTGAEVSVSADTITSDSGRRLGATIGVDQQFQINERWSAGFGFARREQIDDGDGEVPIDPTADAAFSPLETAPASPLTLTESFTSAFIGAGYRDEATAASARLEVRDSVLGQRFVGLLGAAREASETLSFALAGRIQQELLNDTANRRRGEARLGVSYRPRDDGPIVLNRFDVVHDETVGEQSSFRLVNNLALNTYLSRRTQIAAFYGVKYTETTIGPDQFDGFTHLIGGEFRHDITKRVDVGFTGSALINQNTGTVDFSYGPTIGFSPAKNTAFEFGYNFDGFTDTDFQAAEFSRRGPFFKLRVKFDQNTAAGLLQRISPGGR